VGDRLIEDLPVRFTAVAVDLLAGREVWLDEGPLDRAVRASIGIPGVITPAVVNGRLLVDGGVLNPVPVAATATAHADVVVAVSLQGQRARNAGAMPTRETAERRPSVEWWDRFRSNAAGVLASDTMASLTQRLGALVAGTGQVGPNGDTDAPPSISMFEALSLSLDASQSALTRYCLAAHAPDVLISVPKDACRTLDFHKATEMIEIGRKLADEAFDSAQL
jgi:NTE family protein